MKILDIDGIELREMQRVTASIAVLELIVNELQIAGYQLSASAKSGEYADEDWLKLAEIDVRLDAALVNYRSHRQRFNDTRIKQESEKGKECLS